MSGPARLLRLACFAGVIGFTSGSAFSKDWDTTVFRDDFETSPGPPDAFKWVVNHPGESWWTQGSTHFPNPLMTTGPFPKIERVPLGDQEIGVLVIEHHLYNPWDQGDPNEWFLGGEVHSILEFDASRSYRIEARVRLGQYPDGFVTSFFTFGHDGCTSDEIDFEFVSKLTNAGGAVTTTAWNEGCQSPRCPCLECVCDCPWIGCACEEQCSCSAGDCSAPANLDLAQWNTFRIYWYPDDHRIVWTWLANTDADEEIVLRTETDVHFIPDEPMSVYLNFWAADETWGCAFDGSLKPVNDSALNQVLRYEIDHVEVRELRSTSCRSRARLEPPLVGSTAFVGNSVSLSGEVAIIGANGDDEYGTDAGCAHVFRRLGGRWGYEQKLRASDAAAFDRFGSSVSIDGDMVIIGASDDNRPGCSRCGAAYVFRWNGTSWTEQQKLTGSDSLPGDYFGTSVSISGNVVAVGAHETDCQAGFRCGSAYVFHENGNAWVEQQKLAPAVPEANEIFGYSVSVSGDVIGVGTWAEAAYVFRYNGATWAQEQKLYAWDGEANDLFGRDISVHGDHIVTGAMLDDCDDGWDCGSAYVFRLDNSNWVAQQKLTATDEQADGLFGFSVSADSDVIAVGANSCCFAECPGCGSAEVFRWNGYAWIRQEELTAGEPSAPDGFGRAVSVSGNQVVVGALQAECDAGQDCGIAYSFGICPDLDLDGVCDSTDVCTATPLAIAVDGSGRPLGDIDGDCDVDLADFSYFQLGFSGLVPGPIVPPEPFPNQVIGETEKLMPHELEGLADFGWSASVSGDVAIIGARREEYNGAAAGAAFVFRRNPQNQEAWPEEDKLLPSDGAGLDEFGISVSISGDVAIVGAHLNNDLGVHSGSAYVFRASLDSWTEEQKLLPSDGATEARFGRSVSILGEWAVVGAPGVGSAYVFRWDGSSWIEFQKLEPDNGSPGDGFGFSTSLGCRWLVVGAQFDDDKGEDAGAAYVYRWNGTSWGFVQKLTAADGEAGDAFGLAVTVHEDSLIVGAPFERPNPLAYGSAYAFRWIPAIDSWVEEKKLLPSDTIGFLVFGISVSLFGNTAIVGAPNEGFPHGAAYVFRRSGADWRQIAKLSPSDSASFDRFGWSVTVSDGVGVVGAFPSQGVRSHAYLFTGICEDFDGDRVCNSVDLCPGTPPGIVVDNQGRPRADIDDDCDADLGDARCLQEGFTGPGGP